MDLSKPFEKNDFVGSGSLLGVNEFIYCDDAELRAYRSLCRKEE